MPEKFFLSLCFFREKILSLYGSGKTHKNFKNIEKENGYEKA